MPNTDLPPAEYWLEIKVFSVSCPDYMPIGNLGVSVNGVALAQTRVTGNVRVIVPISASALTNRRKITIEIHYPRIGPANYQNATGDARELGIGLTDIVIYAPAGD